MGEGEFDVGTADDESVSDWERAVVVWNKGNDSMWIPAQLFLSQHTGYQKIEWGDIKSTFETRDAVKPRGGCDGQQHLDHPKVRDPISSTYLSSHEKHTNCV